MKTQAYSNGPVLNLFSDQVQKHVSPILELLCKVHGIATIELLVPKLLHNYQRFSADCAIASHSDLGAVAERDQATKQPRFRSLWTATSTDPPKINHFPQDEGSEDEKRQTKRVTRIFQKFRRNKQLQKAQAEASSYLDANIAADLAEDTSNMAGAPQNLSPFGFGDAVSPDFEHMLRADDSGSPLGADDHCLDNESVRTVSFKTFDLTRKALESSFADRDAGLGDNLFASPAAVPNSGEQEDDSL